MSLLPDPVETLLVWIFGPTLVVVVIMTILSALDYFRYAVAALAVGRRATTKLAELLATVGPLRSAMRLASEAFWQGAFVAVSYSLAQLATVTFRNDLDSGRLYDTSEVLTEIVSYEHWTPITSNVVLTALALVAIAQIGRFTNASWLSAAPLVIVVPIGAACLLLALVAVIPGAIVLISGLVGDEHGYTVEMSYFYGIWIVTLASWAATAAASFAPRAAQSTRAKRPTYEIF